MRIRRQQVEARASINENTPRQEESIKQLGSTEGSSFKQILSTLVIMSEIEPSGTEEVLADENWIKAKQKNCISSA